MTKVKSEDVSSMKALLEYTGQKETSCTFRNYSLVARRKRDGSIGVKAYRKQTREPLTAKGDLKVCLTPM